MLHLEELGSLLIFVLALLFSGALLIIFLSSLEDCFIDLLWLSALLLGTKEKISLEEEGEERPLAVLLPAWQEAEVLPQSLTHLLRTTRYRNFRVFVGYYPNDPATEAAVKRVAQRDERVIPIVNWRPGPTCKADCLNRLLEGILEWEARKQVRFAAFILQDAEDKTHPLALSCFNRALTDYDLIQLPVVPLVRRWGACIGGHYMDEFAEMHGKDLPVRALVTGIVPGCGVATAYARQVLMNARDSPKGAFNCDSLTEDYDLSYRLAALAPRQLFLRSLGSRRCVTDTRRDLIATREIFPDRLRDAVRQKARWIVGNSFQGWRDLGWRGSLATRYFFFRDRKIIVCGHASLISYLGLIYSLAQQVTSDLLLDLPLPPLLSQGDLLWQVVLINLAFLSYRLGVRHFCVWSLYGWRPLPLVVPRYFVGTLVNYLALCRASGIFIRHLLTGEPIGWDKTSHFFPATSESDPKVLAPRPAIEGAL